MQKIRSIGKSAAHTPAPSARQTARKSPRSCARSWPRIRNSARRNVRVSRSIGSRAPTGSQRTTTTGCSLGSTAPARSASRYPASGFASIIATPRTRCAVCFAGGAISGSATSATIRAFCARRQRISRPRAACHLRSLTRKALPRAGARDTPRQHLPELFPCALSQLIEPLPELSRCPLPQARGTRDRPIGRQEGLDPHLRAGDRPYRAMTSTSPSTPLTTLNSRS
jgi:hypothetical protein